MRLVTNKDAAAKIHATAKRARVKPSDLPDLATYGGRRSLTEVMKILMDGDPNYLLDGNVPIVKLGKKIRDELIGPEVPIYKSVHVLELLWERLEGRVPEKLEVAATIRGVIALPVLRAGEMDWTADAVRALAPARPPEPPALDAEEVTDAPSPKDDRGEPEP